jgi:dinuclear metal center YbgI/SA1388 family protein
MTTRQELLAALDDLLQPARFKDYGPNGLQVEGRSEVRHIVSGVTASLALIDAAIAEGADAIFVHHGLFWRGQDGCITGWMRQRVARLLANDINLFAYHLPLDAHPELGNNAQLGARLGLKIQGNFGEQMLGCLGDLDAPLGGVDALAQQLQSLCGRAAVAVDAKPGPLRRVGWCSGGAQGYFEAAIAAGVDVFTPWAPSGKVCSNTTRPASGSSLKRSHTLVGGLPVVTYSNWRGECRQRKEGQNECVRVW